MEEITVDLNATHTLDRTIFDALPIPAFVVDDDVQILALNSSASQFCGQNQEAAYRRRSGHVLHCIHSNDVPEGCGRGPACKSCVIRNSVTASLKGQTVSRRRVSLHVADGLHDRELQILVTACPLDRDDDDAAAQALLMMEDITSLATLKKLVPICMRCKSIREDEEYWQTVENYFHDHMGVDFSHGLCPQCVDEFYPEMRKKEL
jgi:PAS domain-containing protein